MSFNLVKDYSVKQGGSFVPTLHVPRCLHY